MFEKTMSKNKTVQTKYISKPNEPNLIYLNNKYSCENIYIVEKIHSIEGVEYDATLIVEHKSITNKEKSLYVCMLLKTGLHQKNALDDIINGKETEITLNDFINSTKGIVYENNDLLKSNIIIFTSPILVNTTFSDIKKGTIYLAPFVDGYNTQKIEPILASMKEGFIEGNTDMAGYCVPISENDPTIDDTMLTQFDSKLFKNDTTEKSVITILNFMGFFLVLLVVVFLVPFIYLSGIITIINDNLHFTPQQRLNRLYGLDVIISGFIFLLSIYFVSDGYRTNKFEYTVAGFYIFIFLIGSILAVQFSRLSNEAAFLKKFEIGTAGEIPAKIEIVNSDWYGLLKDNLFALIYKTEFETDNTTGKLQAKLKLKMFHLIWFLMIYGLLSIIVWNLDKSKNDDNKLLNMSSVSFIIILLSFFMFTLFIHNHYDYTVKT